MNIVRTGKTVFNILIRKEKIDAHTVTRKGEESCVEHTVNIAKENEVKALGKAPDRLTVVQLKVLIALLK